MSRSEGNVCHLDKRVDAAGTFAVGETSAYSVTCVFKSLDVLVTFANINVCLKSARTYNGGKDYENVIFMEQ